MPRSRTNPKRAGHVRRYALKNAHYQRVLAYWEAEIITIGFMPL